VQVPGKEDNKLLTVGRAELDMSQYVLSEGTPQAKMIPILFKVGMASTGYLKISITAEVVEGGPDSEDGMTEVSGLTGMTANLGDDQDLSGKQASTHWPPAPSLCISLKNAPHWHLFWCKHLLGSHTAPQPVWLLEYAAAVTFCTCLLQVLMKTGQHKPAVGRRVVHAADHPAGSPLRPCPLESLTARQQKPTKSAALPAPVRPSQEPSQQLRPMMTRTSPL